MVYRVFLIFLFALFNKSIFAQRQEIFLKHNWKFSREDNSINSSENMDDRHWAVVDVPHDWAITGPFDKESDKQVVAIEQNGETVASEKTGRSGALPWIGVGWYRTRLFIDGKYYHNMQK